MIIIIEWEKIRAFCDRFIRKKNATQNTEWTRKKNIKKNNSAFIVCLVATQGYTVGIHLVPLNKYSVQK